MFLVCLFYERRSKVQSTHVISTRGPFQRYELGQNEGVAEIWIAKFRSFHVYMKYGGCKHVFVTAATVFGDTYSLYICKHVIRDNSI